MKNLITFAGLILGLMLSASTITAQFITGPQYLSVFTNTGTVQVLGNVSSNIPVEMARVVTIGAKGFGVFGTFGVTNAITNGTTITIEMVPDINGTNASTGGNAQQGTMSFIVPAVGTSPFYYWTNVAETSVNLGNLRAVRVKTVNPTNATSSIWITNLYLVTRP